jgi:hypothetical protein
VTRLADLVPLLTIAAGAFVIFYARRAAEDWARRTLDEAGASDLPVVRFFDRLSSPWILIPGGLYGIGIGALGYAGTDVGVPWWVYALVGLVTIGAGFDKLLRPHSSRSR